MHNTTEAPKPARSAPLKRCKHASHCHHIGNKSKCCACLEQRSRLCKRKHDWFERYCTGCADFRRRIRDAKWTRRKDEWLASIGDTTFQRPPASCKHFSTCDLVFTGGKCCACCDKRPKRSARQENGDEWFRHYCPGCRTARAVKREARALKLQEDFDLWKAAPNYDPERTKLFVNFILRQRIFIFEVAHVILSFVYRIPPIPFFSYFDRPKAVPRTVAAITEANRKAIDLKRYGGPRPPSTVASYAMVPLGRRTPCSPQSDHSFCSINRGNRANGCCLCLDGRANKKVDVVYVDGKGEVVQDVDFYQFYCPGCRDYYSSHPEIQVPSGAIVEFRGTGSSLKEGHLKKLPPTLLL